MDHLATEPAPAAIGQPAAEGVSPKRIQLSRAKGWRLPAGAVKVDRSTQWGNPYRIGEPMDMRAARRWGWNISPEGRKLVCLDAAEAVARFCHCLRWDEAIHTYVREQLGGRDLACWCAPDEPCHADILLRVANSRPGVISAANAVADEMMIEIAAHLAEPLAY